MSVRIRHVVICTEIVPLVSETNTGVHSKCPLPVMVLGSI